MVTLSVKKMASACSLVLEHPIKEIEEEHEHPAGAAYAKVSRAVRPHHAALRSRTLACPVHRSDRFNSEQGKEI
jgi:hypothetical protein